MKRWQAAIIAIFLAACASAGPQAGRTNDLEPGGAPDVSSPRAQSEAPLEAAKLVRTDLEDLGPAPELSNEVWLNSDQPLRLADLRGSVVLLDMWTFG